MNRGSAYAELIAARAHHDEVFSRGNATEGQEGRAEYRLRQAEAGIGHAAMELAAARAHHDEVMSRGNATEGQEGRAEYRLRQAERAAGIY